ncbi:nucleoprotein TPR-like isoform X4 [Seriola dumerili]|uniref:nucleoprotein TPR-like isoform X4 n=1 Tax=Seriola dumerili TaxID=41447 RepID=UPI000BBF198C|nr:nucleoprotein TPR-like isoform X4 [Seriola dumerili]
MGTQGTGRKRSTKKERSTAEDDALNLIAREAEARLAAKRAARAEAREIRMKELERQQKELSDDDERMSVGSRGSVRSDLDAVGAYGGGSSYASSDLYSLNGLSSSRNPGSAFNGYQFHRSLSQISQQLYRRSSLYDDSASLCSGTRRVSGSSCHPLEYTSYRGSSSRASSRASSARASPVDNCGSVASFLRSAASSSGLPRDLDDVTIPDFSDVSRFAPAGGRGCEVEDRDYLEKGSRAASALTAATLTSLGGTSSRRGSGDTAITADTETSIREIKEIHELKDQIQDVESKYTQNLKEVKDALVEVEEKYRKAMVSNAQLDNEKNNLMYQVDTLKDSLMELEELLSESRREYEEKVKEFEREKHAHSVLQFQFNEMKEMLKQSEELLNDIRQLRMKQDGFVREISDLQETVEWKDKKIGALERQKEYTDAIRTERDELREEVVKLKDILKKHGIVLGPDLNVNGDIGEAEVDGSPSGDAARQPAQDPQTPPTEGNSMLGNTEETQLRRSEEEEVDPEQHQEMLNEEAKENQLSSDTLCNAADVSTLETSSEEHAEEQQTCLRTAEDSVGEIGLSEDRNVDSNDHPITEAKDIIVCSPEPQEVVTSAEDNVQETEIPAGGDSGESTNPDLEETEIKSSDDFRETCNKVCEEQENKQEDAEEGNLRNTESCPRQEVIKDVVKENLAHKTISAVSNTEPQPELENPEEVENDEAEETSSKSQSTTASGKKKKKKRRGKKKGGNQQKEGTEKENIKTKQDVETATRDNGSSTEPNIDDSVSETPKKSKVDQVKKEQDRKEPEEVDAAKAVEHTETFSHKDALKEPRMEHVTKEHDEEQTLETETVEEIKEVAPTETLSHTETLEEIKVDHVTNEQNKEQSSKSEIVETVEAVAAAETFSHFETLTDLRTEPTKDDQDEEQTLETEEVEKVDCITNPPEADVSTSDLIDTSNGTESTDGLLKECTYSEDDAVNADIATEGEVMQSESEVVDHVEEEVGSVDEMKPECTADNPENSLEPNSKENTDVPNNGDVAADESVSTNSSEREDFTSVSFAGDLTDHLKNPSESEPPSEPSAARSLLSDAVPEEEGPEEEAEKVKDEEEPGEETEQECFFPSVISPACDGGDSELKQDGAQKEEPKQDLKEPEDLVEPEPEVKPDSSSHDEKSDSWTGASLMKNTDALDAEESLLETETQVQPLDDVESQTLECVEQTDDSNAKVSLEREEINTTDVLHTPDSPEDAVETGSSVEQDLSTEDTTVEDPENKLSQNDQESETLSPLAEREDSSQPTQQESDEEDGEDEEGQSFDFDDLDIEAAVATNPSKNQEQEEAEEGVEVDADDSNDVSLELCQSNTETDENTQNKTIESEDGNQVDTLDKESDAVPQDNQNSLAHEEAAEDGTRQITEEGKVVGESGVVEENINQETSLPVEEGLDAVKHELQGDDLVLPKSADQEAGNKEPPQSGKDLKKNGKKGKGKAKEDCKMS